MSALAFSSPGKALIAGGYLVLDPQYDSYVTALSSRMHAIVKSKVVESGARIAIKSPQFKDGAWTYEGTKEVNGNFNPFLESVVDIITKYVSPQEPYDIDITVYSDPGFHTQQNTSIKTSSNGSKQFLYHSQKITEIPKTGLGSSACLTSVVVTALMSQFKPECIENKNILHNISQIAHCKAQGKIGSGFDVAAAIYGSIKYRRFKPELIEQYLESPQQVNLVDLVEKEWDFTHEPCALPPHIRLLMGDIDGGSETPKLVSTVLKWRKENPDESLELYTNLNESNLALIDALKELHELYDSDKETYMQCIEQIIGDGKSSNTKFENLVKAIGQIRKYLKQLTIKSTAVIEPEEQTTLLNDCNTLVGCLGGVVPGAGGYDAISLLVVDSCIDKIIANKDAKFSHVNWLHLREQASGLVAENALDYLGL